MRTLSLRTPDRKPSQPEIDPTWLDHDDATCLGWYLTCTRGYDWSSIYSDPATDAELEGYRAWIDALFSAEESDPGPDPLPYPRETYAVEPIANPALLVVALV